MPRLYGFDNQALTRVRTQERQVVREAVSRLRAGQSQAAVAAWMTAEGHRGTMGGEWTSMTLGRLLDNPAIAGLERDTKTGQLVDTGREALITREEFEWLQQRPSRRGSVRLGEAREPDYEYLVSTGTAECSECSTPLTGGRTSAQSPSYRCQTSRGGCGKVRINAALLEDHIGEEILGELARPGSRAALEQARDQAEGETQRLRACIAALEGSRTELAEPYASGAVSRDAFVAADREITHRLKNARSKLRYAEQLAGVPLGGVEDLARWWEHAPRASKRTLLLLLVEKVVVHPARARGVRDVEGRVELVWRTAHAAV